MAIDDTKLSLCRKFYIEHNGRHHKEIQRLMREAGYKTFSTRCLYRNCGKPGYIERFQWDDELADGGRRKAAKAARNSRRSAIAGGQPGAFSDWLKSVSPQYT